MQLFDDYQVKASRTIAKGVRGTRLLLNCGLGMAGESGEVADLIKKHLFHGHPLDVDKIVEESGDALWYIAGIATFAQIPLSELARRNIAKLVLRYPEGFDSARSLNRMGVPR